MTDADFLRSLGDRHKDTLTVSEYERLHSIALRHESALSDAAIVDGIIRLRTVELRVVPNSTDGWPEWSARSGHLLGVDVGGGMDKARNALRHLIEKHTPAGLRDGGGE